MFNLSTPSAFVGVVTRHSFASLTMCLIWLRWNFIAMAGYDIKFNTACLQFSGIVIHVHTAALQHNGPLCKHCKTDLLALLLKDIGILVTRSPLPQLKQSCRFLWMILVDNSIICLKMVLTCPWAMRLELLKIKPFSLTAFKLSRVK